MSPGLGLACRVSSRCHDDYIFVLVLQYIIVSFSEHMSSSSQRNARSATVSQQQPSQHGQGGNNSSNIMPSSRPSGGIAAFGSPSVLSTSTPGKQQAAISSNLDDSTPGNVVTTDYDTSQLASAGDDPANQGAEEGGLREQDRLLPIANVARIMKQAVPPNAKIAKDAKDTV